MRPRLVNVTTSAQKIDSEVRRLVEDGLNDARRILTEKQHELEALARGLLEYETLSGEEIRNLLDGQPPVRDTGDTVTPSRGSAVPTTRPGRGRPRESDGGVSPAASELMDPLTRRVSGTHALSPCLTQHSTAFSSMPNVGGLKCRLVS